MNFKMQPFFLLFAMALFLVSCGGNVEGEQVQAEEAVETTEKTTASAIAYAVNVDNSVVEWEGAKLIGSDNHVGVVKLENGELLVENGEIVGGSCTLDMTTIKNKDLEGVPNKQAQLEGHLKSGDFFEVEKFPKASFEIVSVTPATDNPDATHQITGNLTMKEITKSITIPANITVSGDQITATTPQFVIDRTEWDVMFNAGALGIAKDKIIKDEIGLVINLSAASATASNES